MTTSIQAGSRDFQETLKTENLSQQKSEAEKCGRREEGSKRSCQQGKVSCAVAGSEAWGMLSKAPRS